MGKGEERSGGRTKASILATAIEAILGGIYWEGGYGAARAVVERRFSAELKQRKLGLQDYKTRLQEISQMLYHVPPAYKLAAESGPNHEKRFVTEIAVGGKILGRGEGKSKKQSEQEAARKALVKLQGRGVGSRQA
jgi:ribonuclease-3